ncbi:hypothetical protein PTNB73_04322 [Pyrenophora teres f. teres]|nr:hypothetical protein HRS9139_04458 [Pyrenophora teres f. teres]CAA9956788.1 MscL Large-conductance mechanosensitive channel [Pyrenophora teres f. maculata]KAE8837669.1 hypothetical protein PTNB85_05004 [Pyrenophora teres f. teres]KAE8839912.1 hypothetical protein HRS9122_06517 [Pyrenophora teres f. teres]KAE8862492.1 hypothetical protein PTNB29_05054 [Pyrenophora teres f. teres]
MPAPPTQDLNTKHPTTNRTLSPYGGNDARTNTNLLSPNSLAASFTACANALVSDIILPIFSLLPFLSRTLDTKFVLLRHGPNSNSTISAGYNTPAQAVDDGAVVLAYGHFLDKIVRFAMVAMALWVIANVYGRCSGDSIVKRQVKYGREDR